MNVRYGVTGGLTAGQLDEMHAAALRVLDEFGVEVSDPGFREKIAPHKGVRVDGTRVRLAPELVDGLVGEYRRTHCGAPVPDEYSIRILSGYAFMLLDPLTGELRPMSTADCIETAKLVDAMHGDGVLGGTPGMPQDVPLALRELLAFKIGCEHSRTAGGVGVTSVKVAEYACRMAEVLGTTLEMAVFALDPLRVEGDTLHMALHLMDMGFTVDLGIHTMPLLGVTTPIHLIAACVENVATVLATFTVFRLMGVTQDLQLGFDVYPFDMKVGTIAYGTPEHVLIYLLGAQIDEYYGGNRFTCKAFHTNAIFPDAHSMAQRASFATVAALNGAREFHFGGMLGIDKVFSPEQLVLDAEIVGYVGRIAEGVRFDRETLGVDLIGEVGPGGEFISHDSTVANCRGLWSSALFDNQSPEQWELGDRKVLADRVRARLRELRDGYDFALDPDKKREIGRLYDAAVKELT